MFCDPVSALGIELAAKGHAGGLDSGGRLGGVITGRGFPKPVEAVSPVDAPDDVLCNRVSNCPIAPGPDPIEFDFSGQLHIDHTLLHGASSPNHALFEGVAGTSRREMFSIDAEFVPARAVQRDVLRDICSLLAGIDKTQRRSAPVCWNVSERPSPVEAPSLWVHHGAHLQLALELSPLVVWLRRFSRGHGNGKMSLQEQVLLWPFSHAMALRQVDAWFHVVEQDLVDTLSALLAMLKQRVSVLEHLPYHMGGTVCTLDRLIINVECLITTLREDHGRRIFLVLLEDMKARCLNKERLARCFQCFSRPGHSATKQERDLMRKDRELACKHLELVLNRAREVGG
eukprot:m.252444 g.252444  ORF g.252444 m.252444 type:complete len:343 (+) comp17773_c0_seq1:564-1592(+)